MANSPIRGRARQFGKQFVVDPEVFAHVLVIRLRVIVPREIKPKFIDDLSALQNPLFKALRRNVLLDPRSNRSLERRFLHLRSRSPGSTVDKRTCDGRSFLRSAFDLWNRLTDGRQEVRDRLLGHEIAPLRCHRISLGQHSGRFGFLPCVDERLSSQLIRLGHVPIDPKATHVGLRRVQRPTGLHIRPSERKVRHVVRRIGLNHVFKLRDALLNVHAKQ